MDSAGNTDEMRGEHEKVIELSVPFSAFSGLSAVINALLLFSAWMIVGIGYLCVPGSVAGAVLALVCAVMNVGNGLAAAGLCLGIGVACAGLCAPILVGVRLAQKVLVRASRMMFRGLTAEGR